ncbi:acyl-CoA dehydrogenase [Mycolicibacterium sp. BK634]|uniref:acyl-CoA dehydrogenase family protein n=1 Tax=Mycolicibacterium sp. BK634 TaxID=2587099 RepID=UPI00162197A3|nr:acyl-CoA dehydrogenase family protein [Mycolicibacterium sp. BK634]MBB3748147.1 acyl-CoA dehydrogenase [Mycolicibacterium sp. BK634]
MTAAWLGSGVAGHSKSKDHGDEHAELRALVKDVCFRSAPAHGERPRRPQMFDAVLWQSLVDAGLTRLTSSADAGASPPDAAVVLHGVARYSGAVPIAETDVIGGWLATVADLPVSVDDALTVGIAEPEDYQRRAGRFEGTVTAVPWGGIATVILGIRHRDKLLVAALDSVTTTSDYNLAGEPRPSVSFDVQESAFSVVDGMLAEELIRRGAWARCVQIIGALDAASELTVAYTQQRRQFGRPLSAFQAVQHSLAHLAGELERARAAVVLAVAAAADHGFGSPQTDYAVTAAKVTLGQVVDSVATTAHQLHGAIGVTLEHDLWLSTTRARTWLTEYGSTNHYARRLGAATMRTCVAGADLWDGATGTRLDGWTGTRKGET